MDEDKDNDEVDPAVWQQMMDRLRKMKPVTEEPEFEDPDPFI